MSYIVIKRINGGDYLYRQTSYREGGKVRTQSEYLCPISTSVAAQVKATKSRLIELNTQAMVNEIASSANAAIEPDKAEESTEENEPLILWRELEGKIMALWVDRKTGAVLKERPSVFGRQSNEDIIAGIRSRLEPNSQAPEKPTNTTNLNIAANVEKHQISGEAIAATHKKFCRQLKAIGLDVDKLPLIKISSSLTSRIAVHRWRSGGYRVNLPVFKEIKALKALKKPHDRRTKFGRKQPRTYTDPSAGTRTEFWREYRKALAYTFLDQLEEQQAQKFKALKQEMSQYYRDHNRAIVHYIKNTNSKSRLGLTLHFKLKKELSGWAKKNIKANGLGLSDHRPRSDWKADCASLLAETQKRGFMATEEYYLDQLAYAQNTTKKAKRELEKLTLLDRLSGKSGKQRKAIKRGEAREQALLATVKKLQVLKPYFVSDFHNSDLQENRRLEDFEIRKMAYDLRKSRQAREDREFREMKADALYRQMERARKQKLQSKNN